MTERRCLWQACLQKGIYFQTKPRKRQDLLCVKTKKRVNGRMIFDKRSFGLRQTLVWVSTNARLCLVFPSFVRGQTEAWFSSSKVAEQMFQSKRLSDAFLGVLRCCREGLLMPSMASLRWLYGTPSMVIRDSFDGNPNFL